MTNSRDIKAANRFIPENLAEVGGPGSMLYTRTGDAFEMLEPGTEGQIIQLVDGQPMWVDADISGGGGGGGAVLGAATAFATRHFEYQDIAGMPYGSSMADWNKLTWQDDYIQVPASGNPITRVGQDFHIAAPGVYQVIFTVALVSYDEALTSTLEFRPGFAGLYVLSSDLLPDGIEPRTAFMVFGDNTYNKFNNATVSAILPVGTDDEVVFSARVMQSSKPANTAYASLTIARIGDIS